jgi:uncharacterized protein YceH (UPF0502 family)
VGPDLSFAEQRVLGCLLEKQRTTPDQYPLTLNALRLACNQSTNRDPVVDLDEATIRDALQGLGRRRFTRLASGQSSRAPKYRHLLDEALEVGAGDRAVLAILLLRGPQTPGELKLRTERLHPFASLEAVEQELDALAGRGLVARLDRRPGQKEVRFAHLLGADEPEGAPEPPAAVAAAADGLPARVAALEEEVGTLRAELARLRDELGA